MSVRSFRSPRQPPELVGRLPCDLVAFVIHSSPMPDPAMTVHAAHRVGGDRAARDDLVYEIAMAFQTILLKDARVPRLDADRLLEVVERKSLRMPEAVVGFGDVFRDRVVRQMTLDACRCLVMAAL